MEAGHKFMVDEQNSPSQAMEDIMFQCAVRWNRWGFTEEKEFLAGKKWMPEGGEGAARLGGKMAARLCNQFSNSTLSSSKKGSVYSLAELAAGEHAIAIEGALVMPNTRSKDAAPLSRPRAAKRVAWENVSSHGEAADFLGGFPKTASNRFDCEGFLMFVKRNVVVQAESLPTKADIESLQQDPHNVPARFCASCTGESSACQLACCAHVALYNQQRALYVSETPLKPPKRGRPKKKDAAPKLKSRGSDFSGRGGMGVVQNNFLDNLETVGAFDWDDAAAYDGPGGIQSFFSSASKSAIGFINKVADGEQVEERAGGRPAIGLIIDFCRQVAVRTKKAAMKESAIALEEKARSAIALPAPIALPF